MISIKGHYALRAMVDLTEHGGEGYVPLEEVIGRQEISKKYPKVIVKELIEGKTLIGLGGRGGGYKLCHKPEEYPVGEILELMEGSLATVTCLSKDANPCSRAAARKALPMRAKFDKMVHDYFYGKTLEGPL